MYLALVLTARYVDYGRSARTRPTQRAEDADRDEHVEPSRRLWHVPMNPTYAIGGSPLRVEGTSRKSMLAATTRVGTVAEEVTLPMFPYHAARLSKVLVDKRGRTRDDRRQPTGTHLFSALIASALTLTLGVPLFTPLAAARPLTPAPDADAIAGPAIGSELADGGHTA